MDSSSYPIIDSVDKEILMHREAHFGGLFSVMLEYYQNEGKGVQEGFSLARIEQLAQWEEELQQNLAPLYLQGPEAELVGEAKKGYKQLREVLERSKKTELPARLIADLLLSESVPPEEEILAIVACGEAAIPSLLHLLQSDSFASPLFPGYGFAHELAAECLGRIGHQKALYPLFEALGEGDFFSDEKILRALKALEGPAKQFLLKKMQSTPYGEENSKAAFALEEFAGDPEVSLAALALLKKPEILLHPALFSYVVLLLGPVREKELQKQFRDLISSLSVPSSAKGEIQAVLKEWESSSA